MLQRRFHAYNVGLPKTGTTSVAGIFSNYRTRHEFLFLETGQAVADWVTGVLSDEELKSFLQQRDAFGRLEMDSSSYNHHYAHFLTELFPDARLLLTIRDCYSWLDSLFNLTLALGKDLADEAIVYGQRSFGIAMTKDMLSTPEAFIQNIPEYLEGFVRLYARANRHVLEHLPAGRSLVVRTQDLSSSLDRLAAFAGVDPRTLRTEKSHLFPADRRFDVLNALDERLVEDLVELHCRPVMNEFFSGYRLRDFLAGRRPV